MIIGLVILQLHTAEFSFQVGLMLSFMTKPQVEVMPFDEGVDTPLSPGSSEFIWLD